MSSDLRFCKTQSAFFVLSILGIIGFLVPAPLMAADSFTFTPENPQIGEEIHFVLSDDSAAPISWDFGGEDCEGTDGLLDCAWTPGYCQAPDWTYGSSGEKTVHLLTPNGETTMTLTVSDSGECCMKDASPHASFRMAPNPAYIGQTITFTYTGPTVAEKTREVGFTFEPAQAEIGQIVTFHITGVSNLEVAEWDFGGDGCNGMDQRQTCRPNIVDCLVNSFTYATSGEKLIQLWVNGASDPITADFTVSDEGSCEDGNCYYTINPLSASFTADGGSSAISIRTTDECSWEAQEAYPWISILSGASGSGEGTVVYEVSPNTDEARIGRITLGGKVHAIHQDAAETPDPGDNGATEWLWTISRDGETILSSTDRDITHVFDEIGLYTVSLEASNCKGSSVAGGVLVVEETPAAPGGWLVSSAVHAPGQGGTQWRTDLWIFNPDETQMDLDLIFRPENTDNSSGDLPFRSLSIPPGGTAALEDVLLDIPGAITGSSALGSLLIEAAESNTAGTEPQIASRTYNETPDGNYGQFVPAIPVPPNAPERLYFSGLAENDSYRTNLRLANLSNSPISPEIMILDEHGLLIGQPDPQPVVPPGSTYQLNMVARLVGISDNLDLFSIRVNTNSPDLMAWVSVVDNHTGDPVLYSPITADHASSTLWIPGPAHLPGANDSEWRSDLTLINPEAWPISANIHYYPSENIDIPPPLEMENFQPQNAVTYPDVLASAFLPEGVNSKGYLVVVGINQNPPLEIAARTYNLAPEGGTFGQNLIAFESKDAVGDQGRGFIPGILLSPDSSTGSRSNLGLLNLDRENWAQMRIRLMDENGQEVGTLDDFWLEPGQAVQFNIAQRFGLQNTDLSGTIVIEHLSGPPVAAYASVVDNRTQDPILIPVLVEGP